MLVVSDTSPLNYLVLVEAVNVLPKLFLEVYAPPAVLAEMCHSKAPQIVRSWALNPPTWLQVREPKSRARAGNLDLGEAEAIALAEELNASALLMDERQATKVARKRGISVIGTVGVLARAIVRELIERDATVAKLQQTNFRGPISLLDEITAKLRQGGFH